MIILRNDYQLNAETITIDVKHGAFIDTQEIFNRNFSPLYMGPMPKLIEPQEMIAAGKKKEKPAGNGAALTWCQSH